jgi:anti-anti-sigma regulatory factor
VRFVVRVCGNQTGVSTIHEPVEAPGHTVGDDAVSSRVLMAIVNARGSIDAARVGPLVRELDGAVRSGAVRLLVDLGSAGDISTAVMNALLAARQPLLRRDGEIAVVLPPRLARRFRMLGLDRRFLLAADRLDAVRLLGLVEDGGRETPRPTAHPRAA